MSEMPSSIEIEAPEIETPEIETGEKTEPQPTFPAQMPTPRPPANGEKRNAVVLSPLTNVCKNNEEMVNVIEATIQRPWNLLSRCLSKIQGQFLLQKFRIKSEKPW